MSEIKNYYYYSPLASYKRHSSNLVCHYRWQHLILYDLSLQFISMLFFSFTTLKASLNNNVYCYNVFAHVDLHMHNNIVRKAVRLSRAITI